MTPITKVYYSLDELIRITIDTDHEAFSESTEVPMMQESTDAPYSSIADYLHRDFNFNERYYTVTNEYKYMNSLFEYIYKRFFNEAAIYLERQITNFHDRESDLVKALESWWMKFFSVYRGTYWKYNELIDYYTSAKTKLMDGIKASNSIKNRINDTPFNGGDYTDDNHTSQFSKSEGETTEERDSPIARLNEINVKLDNIYLQWTNEFGQLFMEV